MVLLAAMALGAAAFALATAPGAQADTGRISAQYQGYTAAGGHDAIAPDDQVLWLEIAELSTGQKGGRVMSFVNGPASVFIERRGDRYVPKRLLNDNVAFTPGFLDFLSRTRLIASIFCPRASSSSQ